MEFTKYSVLLLVLFINVRYGTSDCFCRNLHTQEQICRTPFVGEVRITYEGFDVTEKSQDPNTMIVAKVTIEKIYKGCYQDFDEGLPIYLYTPSSDGACKREFEEGLQLVGGRPYKGGLLVDKCDFLAKMDDLDAEQAATIRHHIRSKNYQLGCEKCRIKRPKEKCFVYPDECPSKCGYPVHTSACLPTGPEGSCQWVKGPVLNDTTAAVANAMKKTAQNKTEVTEMPTATKDPAAVALDHEKPKDNPEMEPTEPLPTERLIVERKTETTTPLVPRVHINTVTYPWTFYTTRRPSGVANLAMTAVWPKWFRRRKRWSE